MTATGPMRFKTDENLPEVAAQTLRDHEFDATSVVEQRLAGQNDSVIRTVCREEDRVLVTLDLDFADIRLLGRAEDAGVIILRLHVQSVPQIVGAISSLIPHLKSRPLRGMIWIVDEASIRVRGH